LGQRWGRGARHAAKSANSGQVFLHGKNKKSGLRLRGALCVRNPKSGMGPGETDAIPRG